MDYVNQKGILKESQVNLTKHAYERYQLRIGNHTREQATSWITKALNNATYLSNSTGKSTYKYKDIKIVVDKHINVITLMKEEPEWESINDTRKDIEDFIIRKLSKEVRPFLKTNKELQIAIYEKEINKLKTNNPQTKMFIQEKIDDLKNQQQNNKTKIEGIVRTAKKYYIEPKKLSAELENY